MSLFFTRGLSFVWSERDEVIGITEDSNGFSTGLRDFSPELVQMYQCGVAHEGYIFKVPY